MPSVLLSKHKYELFLFLSCFNLAIEKIVQEKKISTKINYEVLKSLGMPAAPKSEQLESSKKVKTFLERKSQYLPVFATNFKDAMIAKWQTIKLQSVQNR